jgi:hypothetical protein
MAWRRWVAQRACRVEERYRQKRKLVIQSRIGPFHPMLTDGLVARSNGDWAKAAVGLQQQTRMSRRLRIACLTTRKAARAAFYQPAHQRLAADKGKLGSVVERGVA